MKKSFYLTILFLSFFTFKSFSNRPPDVIPFIYDGHLYLQSKLNNSIDVVLVYDTGADYLYLDEDFLKINHLTDAFGQKVKGRIGGAGNSDGDLIDIFVKPISVESGKFKQRSNITPIIKLRDILGCHCDGLLGNNHLLSTPVLVSFSENYICQLDSVTPAMLEGYTKLDAVFRDNRIDIKAKLQIDADNAIEGLFRMDFGSGGSVNLTNQTASSFDLSKHKKAYYYSQAGGLGGEYESFLIRADSFLICDSFKDVVVDCSLNKKGALSYNQDYLGIIGNDIWSLYDVIIDVENKAVYLKKTSNHTDYSKSSTIHMSYFDRTDICDGWIVNGLYRDGIAEKAGIEIGDIIIAINGRDVKEIKWEEQRKGLSLNGETTLLIKKANGTQVMYTLEIGNRII